MTSAQQWMAWWILGPSDVWNMNVPTPVGVRLRKENLTLTKIICGREKHSFKGLIWMVRGEGGGGTGPFWVNCYPL